MSAGAPLNMASIQQCARCRKAITILELRGGGAVRRGNALYCPQCAAALGGPQPARTAGPAPARDQPPEQPEELEIVAAPEEGAPAAPAIRKPAPGAASPSSRPSRPVLPSIQAGRPAAAGGNVERGSERGGSGARRQVPADAAATGAAAERASARSSSGSRRAAGATLGQASSSSRLAARRPGSSGARNGPSREEEQSQAPDERSAARRHKKLIIIGSSAAGAIVWVLFLVFAFSPSPKPRVQPAPAPPKTATASPDALINKARELEARGEKLKARDAYLDAAELLDNLGRRKEALYYNQQAMRLGKSMTLPELQR